MPQSNRHTTSTAQSTEPAWTDLTGFQRDLLEVVLDTAGLDDPHSGAEIQRELAALRDETISNGRFYPNLKKLTEFGVVESQRLNGRAHGYRPAEDGIELYRDHNDRMSEILSQYRAGRRLTTANPAASSTNC